MKRLTLIRPHHLAKLAEELFAAFPGWITTDATGRQSTAVSISGDGTTVTLWVPDADDPIPIVMSHDPTPPPLVPTPKALLRATIDQALGEPAISPSRMKDILRLLKEVVI